MAKSINRDAQVAHDPFTHRGTEKDTNVTLRNVESVTLRNVTKPAKTLSEELPELRQTPGERVSGKSAVLVYFDTDEYKRLKRMAGGRGVRGYVVAATRAQLLIDEAEGNGV
jgi:hypothetical protein